MEFREGTYCVGKNTGVRGRKEEEDPPMRRWRRLFVRKSNLDS
jgi:hypothetical protein